MYNRLDIEYRRVAAEQTDGRTSCDGIVHAMHTRRAVKMAWTVIRFILLSVYCTACISGMTYYVSSGTLNLAYSL